MSDGTLWRGATGPWAHSRAGWWAWTPLLFCACGAPPSEDATPADATPSEPVAADSDTPRVDSDTPDVPPRTDTGGRRDDDVPMAPAFTRRFVDVSGPLFGDPRYRPYPGTFTDLAGPGKTSALMADLDGDGALELLVGVGRGDIARNTADQFALTWDGQALTAASRLSPLLPPGRGLLHTAADLDGDGEIDLVYGIGLETAWGRPGPGFDAPVSIDPQFNIDGREAIGLWDVDSDGLLDVLVGDAVCGEPGPGLYLLHQQGRRHFVRRHDAFGLGADRHVYIDVFIPTILADGRQRLVVTGGVCDMPHEGVFTEVRRLADGMRVFAYEDPWPVDAPYRADPAAQPLPSFVLLAPMGGMTADLDADGLFDVYVTRSGGNLDLWLGTPSGAYRTPDRLVPIPDPDANPATPDFPWSTGAVDLDGDGLFELLVTYGDDAGSFTRQRWGYAMRQRIEWNAGDGVLVPVPPGSGFDLPGSMRGLVLHDLDGDGDPDVLLGGAGDAPRVLRNDFTTPTLGVRLHGTTSNIHGIGAVVTAVSAATPPRPPQRLLHGAHGNQQSAVEPVSFFTADGPGQPLDVEIKWPTGWTQRVALMPGAVHDVVEPALLTVDHPTRRLVAGSGEVVTVRLTPRDATGAIDTAAQAALQVVGAACVTRPLAGGGVACDITAPAAPGVVTITGVVDGTPLSITPRLWAVAAP